MSVTGVAATEGATRRVAAAVLTNAKLVVAALTALALGIGFVHLDQRGLSLDESVSLQYVHDSWAALWHTATGGDPNMSVYYALLKVWTGIFGDSIVAAKSLSVVLAALTVPVTYALGARLFGTAAGLAAATLLLLNAYFLRYAQEARAYALVALLVTVSSYAFVRCLERPPKWLWALYVASSVLAFYAHYYAAWVVLAQAAVLVTTRREALSRAWLAAYTAVVALVLPGVVWALTLDHNPIGWLKTPGWRALWDTSAQLSGDSFRQVGGVLAVCLLALPWAVRSPRLRWGLTFTTVWVVLPFVGAYLFSQVHPIFLSKYLIVCVPGLMLLVAGAVTSLRPVAAAIAILLALVVMNGPPLRTWYHSPGQEDWPALTAYVLGRDQPGDRIAFNGPYAGDEFGRFAGDDGSLPPYPWPRDPLPAPQPGARRVWFVLGNGQPATEGLRARLSRTHRLEAHKGFEGDVAVELFVRR